MTENAALFLSYNELQNALRWVGGIPLSQELSLGQLAVAAAGAGAITSFFLYVFVYKNERHLTHLAATELL